MKREIIIRGGGVLGHKKKNMETSLLGGLNNESNKKNKIRIRVI
jgi:hypothetical protein